MTERNLIQEWIVKNRELKPSELIDDLDFLSYSYEKYGQTVFAMQQPRCNIALIEDIGKDINDGTRRGYEYTKEFAEYLGNRMALSLAFFKGKTNQEIEHILKEGRL